MEVKIEMKPTSTIIANLGIQENGPVHSFFTNRCYAHMDRFTPYSGSSGSESHLKENVVLTNDSIIYKAPYAHYMWYGKVMGPNIPIINEDGMLIFRSPKGKQKNYTGKDIHYNTPGAGAHWDKRMWTAEGDQVVKEVQDFVDKRRKND